MQTFEVPVSLPGIMLKPQTSLQFGLWNLEGVGNFYLKKFGLHWAKSGSPQQALKINQALPALYAGIWTGDGAHSLGPSGSPLVSVGLEGQGFNGTLPYTVHDFWGPDSIWAAVVNNTTNLQITVTVTGAASWVASVAANTVQGVDTTATTSSTVVITNSPTQVIV